MGGVLGGHVLNIDFIAALNLNSCCTCIFVLFIIYFILAFWKC